MRNSTKWLLLSGIILGLIFGLYSTYLDFLLHWGIDSNGLICSVNEYIDCKSVYLSKYSKVFNFSKSLLGFLFYIILLFNFIFLTRNTDESRFDLFFLFLMIGAFFSIYNLYLLVFVIQKICLICLILQVIGIFLFTTVMIERKFLYKDVYSIKFTKYFYSQLILISFILLSGFQIQKKMNSYWSKENGNNKADSYISNYYSSDKIEFNFNDQFSILGNKNSKIEIVIFSDFECNYCSNAASILNELYSEHKNDVKIIFVHYPLDKTVNPHTPKGSHILAGLASKVSICMSQKDSFWKTHDYFFENQDNFSRDFFYDYLDKYNLKDCLDDKKTILFLNSNMDLAKAANVEGTPTIYINGKRIIKWYDKELLSKIIHFEKLFQKQN